MALKKECPECKYRNSVSLRKCARCGASLVSQGIVYWVDVWVGGRRIRERVGPSREAAAARELKLKREKARAKVMGVRELAMSYRLEDLWPRYATWCKIHNRDFKGKKSRWVNQLKPFFGKKTLDQITRRLVETYRNRRLSEGARPASVNREVSLLRHMLRMAVEWGFLDRNPLEGLGNLREENDDRWRYLTEEEFERLELAVNDTYRDLLVFLAYTGLRLGDALRLTPQDVDLRGEVILIRGSKTKGGRAFGIPMHPRVKEILERRIQNGTAPEERIFRHSDSEFRRAFKRALEKAELPTSIRIHDLRHTFASWLALKGVPIQQIQALLGHSQLSTTLRYAHLNPAVLRDAVERI